MANGDGVEEEDRLVAAKSTSRAEERFCHQPVKTFVKSRLCPWLRE